MKIHAYAAMEKGESLVPYKIEDYPLGDNDVQIRISHCGICHSDLHLIDNDWQSSTYPLVPGHEIVGVVKERGKNVKHLEIGQRVGVGWQSGSCQTCEWCNSGQEQLCEQHQPTAVGRPGGFADTIITDSRFAFPIPDALSSENAAPLLCGGITVYTPLKIYGIKPHMKVGVIGIGGLGHLAIQFASAMGCEVTAFSSTPEKEAEAKSFGATHFINSRDEKALSALKKSFDFILSTVFVDLDWNLYVSLLRPNGRLNFVGAAGMVSIPIGNILRNISISGSIIGSRATIQEMLEFAARHGIQAKTEVMPMEMVNEAIQKVRKNRARYRMVLKNQ